MDEGRREFTDAERIEWLDSNPVITKWTHDRGWKVTIWSGDESEGSTIRYAIDEAIRAQNQRNREGDY